MLYNCSRANNYLLIELLTMNVSVIDDLSNNRINIILNETSKTGLSFLLIGLLCVSPFVIAGNVLILLAICKFSSLHKVTYYFLGNLAVADIIVAVGLATQNLSILLGLGDIPLICGNLTVTVSNGVSLSGTVLVSLHSFLAVKFPVRFRDGFDHKTAGIIGVITWLFWIGHTLTGILTANFHSVSPDTAAVPFTRGYIVSKSVFNLINLLILVCLQVSTVLLIRKKKAALHTQGPPGNPITTAALDRLNNTSRIVWIVSVIAVLCIIAWLPNSILLLLITYCPSCGVKTLHVRIASLGFVPNMIGNIIIYFIKSRELKKVFKILCKCRSNQVHPE